MHACMRIANQNHYIYGIADKNVEFMVCCTICMQLQDDFLYKVYSWHAAE